MLLGAQSFDRRHLTAGFTFEPALPLSCWLSLPIRETDTLCAGYPPSISSSRAVPHPLFLDRWHHGVEQGWSRRLQVWVYKEPGPCWFSIEIMICLTRLHWMGGARSSRDLVASIRDDSLIMNT